VLTYIFEPLQGFMDIVNNFFINIIGGTIAKISEIFE
jgi:hypothetical protein